MSIRLPPPSSRYAWRGRRRRDLLNLIYVLPSREPQAMVPRDTPARLVFGLVAPDRTRPWARPRAAHCRPPCPSFSAGMVAARRGGDWSDNSPSGDRIRERRLRRAEAIFILRWWPEG